MKLNNVVKLIRAVAEWGDEEYLTVTKMLDALERQHALEDAAESWHITECHLKYPGEQLYAVYDEQDELRMLVIVNNDQDPFRREVTYFWIGGTRDR